MKSRKANPLHVAIIMDGNGRWALERNLTRLDGHRRGASVVREITTHAREVGVRFLTLYSFSVQNWNRPSSEISGLMLLLKEYCRDEENTLLENSIRFRVIGRLDRLPPATRTAVSTLVEKTEQLDGMDLILALDYGGREEIVQAARALAERVQAGDLLPEQISENDLVTGLSTAEIPYPDLLIRTSGEKRVSNFLLWQIAYTEFYFSPQFWPDFTPGHFDEALADFRSRERRFGNIMEPR